MTSNNLENELKDMHEKANELKAQETTTQITLPKNNAWGISPEGLKAIQKGVEMYQTTHGLYSSIPLICKGEDCIYAQIDPLHKEGLCTEGERCLTEIALIMTKYDSYKRELGIGDSDAVDLSLMRDLIDFDVQILRAEAKMAMDGDFVKDVLTGITESGREIMQEQITQAAQYKDKIQTKRNRTLELLSSTRKDKKGDRLSVTLDPSTYASKLMKDAEISGEIIEAEYAEFDNLERVPDVESNI